jgi:P-type Ca2+ transporter type 2C
MLQGLTTEEAYERLKQHGANRLPQPKIPGITLLFFRQFLSPLIYILLFAAVVSFVLGDASDAIFILLVLCINALIGTIQEYSAQKASNSLKKMVPDFANVLRDGQKVRLESEKIVPGDIIFLESGDKVPADIQLTETKNFSIDESMLTGESIAVSKHAGTPLPNNNDIAFAGTMVLRGRSIGIVIATSIHTALGKIAKSISTVPVAKPPLMLRIEEFSLRLSIAVLLITALLLVISWYQGGHFGEILMIAVALAVSAIPEGLPAVITITLAIGMRRMASNNVIIRKLLAVESLGSCTMIASDKTGTLTINQLTACTVALPNAVPIQITGEGTTSPNATFLEPLDDNRDLAQFQELCRSAILTNEATLKEDGNHKGDMVDIAFLIMGRNIGLRRNELLTEYKEISTLPYESENGYSASINQHGVSSCIVIKGSPEKLLQMCSHMLVKNQPHPIGYKVIAVAKGEVNSPLPADNLHHLTFLGLVGMIDPLRPESKNAVALCKQAGIQVAMITGDHPTTARTIAVTLGLCKQDHNVINGSDITKASDEGQEALDRLVSTGIVFARISPQQKQQIVDSLMRQGHFVAVTGDGVNDAPALSHSHVGVAMGKRGTDVAKESADLIITDDNFSSIVKGINEGRVIYNNIRNVIFMLVSTGAAEIVLFILALIAGLPMPLLATQLLWLNLVTNGIQDVAMAFEPGDGNELKQPPRKPNEPIFDRLMIGRVVIHAIFIGAAAFSTFQWLIAHGYSLESARNMTLLLMVLFENIHILNSRSERLSICKQKFFRNHFLLIAIIAAQSLHIAAMHIPVLRDTLHIQAVSLHEWAILLAVAFSVLMVGEIQKKYMATSGVNQSMRQ